MADLVGFSPSDYERKSNVLPEGWYQAIVVSSDEKPTRSDPENKCFHIVFEILDEVAYKTQVKVKGQRLTVYLNFKHKNDVTQQIAREDFSDICRAACVYHPLKTDDVHNIPIGILVKHKKKEYMGEERIENEVKKYCKLDDLHKARDAYIAAAATGGQMPWNARKA